MHSKLEDAKNQLIAEAAKLAEQRRGGMDGHVPSAAKTQHLLSLYYRHVAPEDLLDRSPVDIYGAAMSHFRLAATRPQGTAAVRVFTPSVDEHEWAADGHTVVEVVTDDMPFLVDSVTMALTTRDRAIHVVIHPQLVIRRDVTGALQEVCDGDRVDDDEPDLMRESWMHIEIDRETDPRQLDEIDGQMSGILRDVREVVEDWDKMNTQALQIVHRHGVF